MSKLSTNEVIDLIFGELDKSGELFDALMHTMMEVDSLAWGSSPTMMVDLRVPHVVREFLNSLAMPDDVTRGEFESALFTFFVIHGITNVLKNNSGRRSSGMGDIVTKLMESLGATAIPVERDSELGNIIGKILQSAKMEDIHGDSDCSTCDKADECPIAHKDDDDSAGHC